MNKVISPIIFDPIEYEKWTYVTDKSVPGVVPNMYMVSNFGKVYSFFSNRLLNLIETNNGYFRVNLTLISGISRYYLIHRIVLIEFNCIDNYKEMQVNHKDCDKSNNYDDNLEWMTGSENILHAYRNGVKVKEKGEDCSYATITNAQAEQVAQLITEQIYSQKEISQITNVPVYIVANIAQGTTWRFVYEKYNLEQYKRKVNIWFSDEQLHMLCKYFEENSYKYIRKSDLYRDALKDLFNIKYQQTMSGTLSRIYNKQTRKEITCKYNF